MELVQQIDIVMINEWITWRRILSTAHICPVSNLWPGGSHWMIINIYSRVLCRFCTSFAVKDPHGTEMSLFLWRRRWDCQISGHRGDGGVLRKRQQALGELDDGLWWHVFSRNNTVMKFITRCQVSWISLYYYEHKKDQTVYVEQLMQQTGL